MNFIDPKLLDYCEKHSSGEPEILTEISRQTHLTQINPRMLSGHLQGTFLKLITGLVDPVNVLEIGTYTGYSAICMAMGMREGSKIHTIEIDEELKDVITRNFERAGVSEKIELHIGSALEIIPQLTGENKFDLVFIDADKENYPAYFSLIKDNLANGGVIIADNVLWSGKVLNEQERESDPDTKAIHRFNEILASDRSFEKVLLPVRDGITIARKI